MPANCLTVALGIAMQVGPAVPYGQPAPTYYGAPIPEAYGTYAPSGVPYGQPGPAMHVPPAPGPVGQPAPSEAPNYPALQNAYNHYGFEGQYEQRYPFDTQQNWVHGYFQEVPAYGGHAFYRPYNYKDVLSQSQTAAGWGAAPSLPYSQQFWHRYHDRATMLKLSQYDGVERQGHPQATPNSYQPIAPAGGFGPGTTPAATGTPYVPAGQPYYYAPLPTPGYAPNSYPSASGPVLVPGQ